MAVVEVRVQPRAGRNAVEVVGASKLKIYVTAPPSEGRANEAAIAQLADWLGVPTRSIRVLRGRKSRDKAMLIKGIEAGELEARLSAGRRSGSGG